MRISDWSSDVCSSDLIGIPTTANIGDGRIYTVEGRIAIRPAPRLTLDGSIIYNDSRLSRPAQFLRLRSEEHTSELQSLMRISYAVFCLKKNKSHRRYKLQTTSCKSYRQTLSR